VVSLPSEMALASSEFAVLKPTGVDVSALWSAARQPGVSERLQRRVVGTSGSHQRIQPRDLLDVSVPDVARLPTAALRTITGLGACSHARRTESARLSALRDTLLPLLISGALPIRSPR
jgi:hypothetical protein